MDELLKMEDHREEEFIKLNNAVDKLHKENKFVFNI